MLIEDQWAIKALRSIAPEQEFRDYTDEQLLELLKKHPRQTNKPISFPYDIHATLAEIRAIRRAAGKPPVAPGIYRSNVE